MKIILFVLLSFVCVWTACAEPFDYSKVKPEHYKNLKNKSEFTDKEGLVFRIKNTEYAKGLYIQVVKGGRKKWQKHGVFYQFYEGKLTGLETYSYGKKEGLRETYYKGVIEIRQYYHLGRQHGRAEQFNSKGKLIEECTYKNGKKQGRLYSYVNGRVEFEKDFVDGKRHGLVLQYDSKGKLLARTKYNKGKQVGKTQWLH